MESYLKKAFLLCMGLLMSQICLGQWIVQNSTVNDNLRDVEFLNATTGYVVGNKGVILKTTDGGTTWVKQTSGVATNLNTVDFVTVDTGFAVGDNGVILKTTNGGTTWVAQTSGTTFNLVGVQFLNANVGYILGNGSDIRGIFLKTISGGSNWDDNGGTYIHETVYSSLFFINPNVGYVTSLSYFKGSPPPYYGKIWKITNGGANWDVVVEGGGDGFHYISFVNDAIGYVSGYGGLRKTTNGTSFETINSMGNFGYAFDFVNEMIGYSVGTQGLVSGTTNGGTQWYVHPTPTVKRLNSVDFVSEDLGYVVGDSGTILKTMNGRALEIEKDAYYELEHIKIYPNPTTGKVLVEVASGALQFRNDVNVKVLDMLGRVVIQLKVESEKLKVEGIDLSNLPKGIYVVEVGNKRVKLVKE